MTDEQYNRPILWFVCHWLYNVSTSVLDWQRCPHFSACIQASSLFFFHFLVSFWPPPIWWWHVFWKHCFLESIPSTPLNGSLRNFNTWRVAIGNRTLRRDFLKSPKTTYFRRLRNSMATLRANISGEEHDINNREMVYHLNQSTTAHPVIHMTR